MKKGTYGFFIASIIMLAIVIIIVACFLLYDAKLDVEIADGEIIGLVALLKGFVALIWVVLGAFMVSVIGLSTAVEAIKGSVKRSFRVISIALCVLHSLIFTLTLVPAVHIIFSFAFG